MRLRLSLIVMLALLFPVDGVAAQSLNEFVRRLDVGAEPPHRNSEEIKFGPHFDQRILFDRAKAGTPPLIVMLEGAGWPDARQDVSLDWLPSFYRESGYAYASIQHRGMPEFSAADAVDDYATGIAQLVRNASEYGFDAGRIILVGSGLSGQFTALLGLDPTILEAHGILFSSVRGIVLFEPPNLNVEERIAHGDNVRAVELRRIFGSGADAQRTLSPTSHLARPNAPFFLLLPSSRDHSDSRELEQFSADLRGADSTVELVEARPSNPRVHSSHVGTPSNPITVTLKTFLTNALPPDDH